MRYKKMTLAVLCFLLISFGNVLAFSIDENISKRLHMLPVLKSFLQALVVQYPPKTFALCVTEDCFPVIVDAAYIQSVSDENVSLTRGAGDGFPLSSSREEIVVSAEAAVNVPLTAFHTASMSAQNGYNELPRPAKIVIQARVLDRPQQQGVPAPQGLIRPGAPNSPWRSMSDSAILFWIFAVVLPSV